MHCMTKCETLLRSYFDSQEEWLTFRSTYPFTFGNDTLQDGGETLRVDYSGTRCPRLIEWFPHGLRIAESEVDLSGPLAEFLIYWNGDKGREFRPKP